MEQSGQQKVENILRDTRKKRSLYHSCEQKVDKRRKTACLKIIQLRPAKFENQTKFDDYY